MKMQLIALANDDAIRNKLHEEVWALLLREPHWKTIRNLFNPGFNQDDATNRKWLYDNIFKHKKVLLIDSVLINRDTEAVDFPAFASDYHLSTSYLGRINDKHDQPIYYLYLVQDTADH